MPDAVCANRVIAIANSNSHVRLMSAARSIRATFSARQRQSDHTTHGNPAADQRARRGALAFQHECKRDDGDRRDSQNSKHNARRRALERPLHATDTERLTGKAVYQHPGPNPTPLLLRGLNNQLMRGVGLDLKGPPLHHQQADSPEQQPAEDALKARIPTIEMLADSVGDFVRTTA